MKDVSIVGVSFYAEEVAKVKEGDVLTLLHQPLFIGKAEYPNCVKVYHNDKQVGSLAESELPESPQLSVVRAIGAGKEVTATVTELIIPTEEDKFFRTFRMNIDLGSTVFMDSFNESGVVVEFDEGEHVYTFEDNTLLSPSKFADKDDFDKQSVSGYCAKAWDMKQDDVLSMWKSGANVSAGFGSEIHGALQHYSTYSKLLPAKEKHRAMPKHTIIRNIINGYIDLNLEGEVMPEVFLTNVEHGLAGQLDELRVLDWDKKICDVVDFKINIDSKKKVKKYADQLFLYTFMLIQSGWEVRNVGVLALEEKWIYHDLNHLREDVLLKIKKEICQTS